MNIRNLALSLLTSIFAANAVAQDAISLHSVTLHANDTVTVVYSKNFATCAHVRFSDATCNQFGSLVHVYNLFCTSGQQVSVNEPRQSFSANLSVGSTVFAHHGNNGNIRSSCVVVGYSASYGVGCAGTMGVPILTTSNAAPPAGTTMDFGISNAYPSSVAVLGFGLQPANHPLFGCRLLIDSVVATVAVPITANGTGLFPLPLPLGSTGASMSTQAWVLDFGGPQGFAATNGLKFTVQ